MLQVVVGNLVTVSEQVVPCLIHPFQFVDKRGLSAPGIGKIGKGEYKIVLCVRNLRFLAVAHALVTGERFSIDGDTSQ